jgi:hypothetical protein
MASFQALSRKSVKVLAVLYQSENMETERDL